MPSDTTRYEIDFYNAIRDEKKPSFVYGNPFESRTKNFVTSLDVSLTFVNLIRYVYIYIYICGGEYRFTLKNKSITK